MSIARKIGNLGTALDSAALSTFLSKGTTDGEFDTIAWGDVTGKPSYIDSSLATQLFDSAYVQARQTAVSSGGLDSAAVTSLIDSNYVAARATAASSSGFVMYNYNATSGQTAFQDSDTAGNVLSYTADGILVYYNGLLLADEDYTATDGAAVTLTEGADSGAQITIGKWNLTGSGSAGGSAVWYGDRALAMGGNSNGDLNRIDYWSVATPSNATDFGDITIARYQSAGMSDGTYGIDAMGYGLDMYNIIDYVTIASPGNATDFGDAGFSSFQCSGIGDGTYGVYHLGYSDNDGLEYITIASPGNGTTFGNLTTSVFGMAATGDGTYGLWAGGSSANAISYVTLATAGNGSSFGNLSTTNRYNPGAGSDTTRGVFCGGYNGSSSVNVIDYVTIATPSNASDFGDLTRSHTRMTNNTGDGTYATFAGGIPAASFGSTVNTIDYITIQTTGNATDFGDLVAANGHPTGCAGSSS